MRIFSATESKRDRSRQVADLLGAGSRLPWVSDRIGPLRLEIRDFSPGFFELLLGQAGPFHASLHKRPKGVLVDLDGPETEGAWALPYHELSVYKSEFLSLHGGGQFLKLTATEEVHDTVRALLEAKAAYLGE